LFAYARGCRGLRQGLTELDDSKEELLRARFELLGLLIHGHKRSNHRANQQSAIESAIRTRIRNPQSAMQSAIAESAIQSAIRIAESAID
jgi:hypothetical protein